MPGASVGVGEVLRVWKDCTIAAKKKPYKVVTPKTSASSRKTRSKPADV